MYINRSSNSLGGVMKVETKPRLDEPGTGSPDDKAHYVDKTKLTRAAVEGGRVRALCGVWFEPVRDPSRFPICEDCVRVRAQRRNAGNN
jgi:hypothetical protein